MRTEADFDFGLDLKAIGETDGDLYIEGWASDFGLDDQDEYFEPGSFRKSVQRFVESGNMPLLYHHKPSQALGVVEQVELRGDGLWMKARIDKPAAGSWAEDIYNKVKRGTIKGLSVGGVFRRRTGPDGKPRIYEAGLREISVTPSPINPRTLFSLAQKAFPDSLEDHEPTEEELEWIEKATETLERLERVFGAIEGKATTKPWDGSASRFSEEQWRRSCVLDRGEKFSGKARYALPVREPGGELNCRGVAAAKGRVGQVKGASPEAVSKARSRLEKLSAQCSSSDE